MQTVDVAAMSDVAVERLAEIVVAEQERRKVGWSK